MNEIIETRTTDTIATEINYIKRRACETLLRESVEIGKLLCEAKKIVPQGEWMSWLSDNVNYSQSTANNLMRLYEEYGEQEQIGFFEENRLEIFGNLSPSQALALIALPYEKRKEYIEEHDMESTSVRDIQAEIKARQEAEERADIAEEKNSTLEEEIKSLREQIKELEEVPEQETVDVESIRSQVTSELEEQYKKALKVAEKEAAEKSKAKLDKLKEEMKLKDEEYEKKLSEETEKAVSAEKARLEKEYADKLSSLGEENKELKRKASVAGSDDVQKFSVHFELFQKECQEVISAISKIRKADSDTADKLKNGLVAVLEQVKKSI